MGVALGLGAALSWGAADYFVALATRSIGALRVALGFHLAALIPLTGLVLATDALARLTASELPVFVLLGSVGWLSYLAFYRALGIGPISLVSPIVSGYAAVTVTLAVLIVGERPSSVEAVAVIATIAGVVLASSGGPRIGRATLDRRAVLGLGLAVVAMVLFGGFLFGVSYYHRRLGWLAPIFLARGFTALFLLGHASRGAKWRWPDPSRTMVGLIALIAVLDTGGYVVFNVALGHAATSVVATASAPYAVVPILMGVYLFRERPNRTQWLGVAVLSGGLMLLALTA